MNWKPYISLGILLTLVTMLGIAVGTNGSLTGATATYQIVCSSDEDCDDGIHGTEDTCRNPGSEYSLCINRKNSE